MMSTAIPANNHFFSVNINKNALSFCFLRNYGNSLFLAGGAKAGAK